MLIYSFTLIIHISVNLCGFMLNVNRVMVTIRVAVVVELMVNCVIHSAATVTDCNLDLRLPRHYTSISSSGTDGNYGWD